jgi:hypothetical protein
MVPFLQYSYLIGRELRDAFLSFRGRSLLCSAVVRDINPGSLLFVLRLYVPLCGPFDLTAQHKFNKLNENRNSFSKYSYVRYKGMILIAVLILLF